MSMPSHGEVRTVAEAFANALDHSDFERVRGLLAPACRYDLRAASLPDEGTLVGPDAIIESYRWHDGRARRLFDRVEYFSAVEAAAGLTAIIRFGDALEKDGQRYTYSCRQRITLNDSGAIESIVQQDITAETLAVRAFMERVGVKL